MHTLGKKAQHPRELVLARRKISSFGFSTSLSLLTHRESQPDSHATHWRSICQRLRLHRNVASKLGQRRDRLPK